MSNVWFCLPARRSAEESTIPAWRAAGYKVAIVREIGLPELECDLYQPCRAYPGWAQSANLLVRRASLMDPIAEWFVLGGDDTLPDPTHTPEDIAAQCSRYFGELHMLRSLGSTAKPGDPVSVETLKACIHGLQNSTMGVMQPTGDDWADQNGKIINRICGSPWIGREFAMRSYRGGGPLYSRYFHNWADQELFHVANRSGLLWQRPDLTHYHRHWNRPHGATREKDMPKWAPPIYSNNDWIYNGGLYKRREAQGFPGAEFLEED